MEWDEIECDGLVTLLATPRHILPSELMFFSPLCNTPLSLQGKCVFLFNCVSVELWVVLGRRRVREGGGGGSREFVQVWLLRSHAPMYICLWPLRGPWSQTVNAEEDVIGKSQRQLFSGRRRSVLDLVSKDGEEAACGASCQHSQVPLCCGRQPPAQAALA